VVLEQTAASSDVRLCTRFRRKSRRDLAASRATRATRRSTVAAMPWLKHIRPRRQAQGLRKLFVLTTQRHIGLSNAFRGSRTARNCPRKEIFITTTQRRSKVFVRSCNFKFKLNTGRNRHGKLVNCVKLGREAEGLDRLPTRPLGQRIFENVSKEAWQGLDSFQTMR